MGLARSRSVTRAAAAGTFPCQLCTTSVTNGKACQDLVTTGSRLFGLGGFGSALKVRIYDFAVYVHPEQVSDLLLLWHEKFCWKMQYAVQCTTHCCAYELHRTHPAPNPLVKLPGNIAEVLLAVCHNLLTQDFV